MENAITASVDPEMYWCCVDSGISTRAASTSLCVVGTAPPFAWMIAVAIEFAPRIFELCESWYSWNSDIQRIPSGERTRSPRTKIGVDEVEPMTRLTFWRLIRAGMSLGTKVSWSVEIGISLSSENPISATSPTRTRTVTGWRATFEATRPSRLLYVSSTVGFSLPVRVVPWGIAFGR